MSQQRQSFETMGRDTTDIALTSLSLEDLLSMRLVNKSTKDLVDEEITRRHMKEFGPADKAIGLRIKDLKLSNLSRKLQPFEHGFIRAACTYGLASWFGVDRHNRNKCVTHLGSRPRRFLDFIILQGLRTYRDHLIQLFPQYTDAILSGYYYHLREQQQNWQDGAPQHSLIDQLESVEGQRYLAMPIDRSFLRHLVKMCPTQANGFAPDGLFQQIVNLRVMTRADVSMEYGTDYAMDADGRIKIRDDIRRSKLDSAYKALLKRYYEYRCQQLGLNPMGIWGEENPEIIAQLLQQQQLLQLQLQQELLQQQQQQ